MELWSAVAQRWGGSLEGRRARGGCGCRAGQGSDVADGCSHEEDVQQSAPLLWSLLWNWTVATITAIVRCVASSERRVVRWSCEHTQQSVSQCRPVKGASGGSRWRTGKEKERNDDVRAVRR